MEVIVPEEQLLLAIGKKGQNVKLASKLVGWHIEVRAEGQVEDALKRAEGLFAKKPEASEAPPEGPEAGAKEGGTPEAPAAEGPEAGTGEGGPSEGTAAEGTAADATEGAPSEPQETDGAGGEAKEGDDPPGA
jgi:N utilization substance protein A